MSDIGITLLLVVALFLILGSGVWIGLTLSGVAWIGMQLFSSRPAGDAMAVISPLPRKHEFTDPFSIVAEPVGLERIVVSTGLFHGHVRYGFSA